MYAAGSTEGTDGEAGCAYARRAGRLMLLPPPGFGPVPVPVPVPEPEPEPESAPAPPEEAELAAEEAPAPGRRWGGMSFHPELAR